MKKAFTTAIHGMACVNWLKQVDGLDAAHHRNGILIKNNVKFKTMIHKIKLTYVNISDSDLPMKALGIVDGMEGNPRFPNPPYTTAVLRTSITDYQNILSVAQKDDRAIPEKNEKRYALQQQLHETAAYVIVTAKNDLDALISSGFDITVPKPRRSLETLSLKPGATSGQIVSQVNRVSNARVYWHQYTPDPLTPESAWTEVMTTSRQFTHSGLHVGSRYWLRVKVLTDTDQEFYTDAVQRLIV
jgi:hypothetical protein